MKVAITSSGEGLSSEVSPVFGRCPYFVVVELGNGKVKNHESIKNSAMDQPGGAGTSAAQLVADKGAEAVVSASIGPKAFSALSQLGIKMYRSVPGTVGKNAEEFAEGKLISLSGPGQMGAGMGRGGGTS